MYIAINLSVLSASDWVVGAALAAAVPLAHYWPVMCLENYANLMLAGYAYEMGWDGMGRGRGLQVWSGWRRAPGGPRTTDPVTMCGNVPCLINNAELLTVISKICLEISDGHLLKIFSDWSDVNLHYSLMFAFMALAEACT